MEHGQHPGLSAWAAAPWGISTQGTPSERRRPCAQAREVPHGRRRQRIRWLGARTDRRRGPRRGRDHRRAQGRHRHPGASPSSGGGGGTTSAQPAATSHPSAAATTPVGGPANDLNAVGVDAPPCTHLATTRSADGGSNLTYPVSDGDSTRCIIKTGDRGDVVSALQRALANCAGQTLPGRRRVRRPDGRRARRGAASRRAARATASTARTRPGCSAGRGPTPTPAISTAAAHRLGRRRSARPPAFVVLGGAGDVALHPAEDDAVERRDRPPVQRARPARAGGRCARCRNTRAGPAVRPRRRRSSQASPGSRISARSRSSAPGSSSSTRQQSSASPTRSVVGSRRPAAQPDAADAAGPASRAPARPAASEYQPLLAADALDRPPTARSGRRSTARSRSSTYRLPPAQSGSLGSGSLGRARRRGADDQRVATSASRIALQRELDGAVEPDQARPAGRARTRRCRARWHDHLVRQRLDQRPGDAVGHRRDRRRPSGWTGRA